MLRWSEARFVLNFSLRFWAFETAVSRVRSLFRWLWTKKLFTPPAVSIPPQFTSYHPPTSSSHLNVPLYSHYLSLTYISSTHSLFHRPRAFQTSPALFCRFLLLFSFPQKQVSLHLYSVAGISFFD